MKSTKQEWTLEGLGCANCANKIEGAVQKMDGVLSASLDFVNSKFHIEVADGYDPTNVRNNVESVMDRIEPGSCIKNDASQSVHEESRLFFNKGRIALYIIGVISFIAAIVLPSKTTAEMLLFILSYLIFGSSVILKSLKNITRGRVFDENFLMMVATIGAFLLGQYPEGASVMLFYQTGELFQNYAVGQSRRSIKKLMDIKPEYANIRTDKGIERIPPANVRVGDRIVVCPGERVPLDGIVLEGCSSLDTSPLTGESLPRDVAEGVEVLSGCINQTGVLTVEVTKSFGQSAVSRVLALIEGASQKKAVTERFITRFALWYTPIVIGFAVLIAILPPLFMGVPFDQWIYRGLLFLVISCPCALVISIPLGFFGGIGAASKKGILIKGGNYLEALAKVGTVVFDKTGTLTTGSFEVFKTTPRQGITEQELLDYAAMVECHSTHPLARSIIKKCDINPDFSRINEYVEIPGKGVRATIDGKKALCGNRRLMDESGINVVDETGNGISLHIAIEGTYAGSISLRDTVKSDTRQAIENLHKMGIKDTVMLTGDEETEARDVAGRIGINRYFAKLLPQDKVSRLETIMEQLRRNHTLAFVGDGINDAAVIARADVGIAMGGMGSDAAIEAADVVIMNDEPTKIYEAVAIARKTRSVVFQNIVLAIVVKILVLILGAGGMATLWEAVFADVGVALLAVLNAMRTMR